MVKDIMYHTGTSIVCAIKDEDSQWGTSETSGSPLKVVSLDVPQSDLDDIGTNNLIIGDTVVTGCWYVDDTTTPTEILKEV